MTRSSYISKQARNRGVQISIMTGRGIGKRYERVDKESEEILKYTVVRNLIPRNPIYTLMKSLDKTGRVSKTAVDVGAKIFEQYILELVEKVLLFTGSAKRVTVNIADVNNALRISGCETLINENISRDHQRERIDRLLRRQHKIISTNKIKELVKSKGSANVQVGEVTAKYIRYLSERHIKACIRKALFYKTAIGVKTLTASVLRAANGDDLTVRRIRKPKRPTLVKNEIDLED